MSQPAQPLDTASGFATHQTASNASTAPAVPESTKIVTTPVHNDDSSSEQPQTKRPASNTALANTTRHDTPHSAPPTTRPIHHTIPPSGDGDHPSIATWGPSIFNMVSRSQRDPSFDLSAQRTYIIDNPVTTPRFQRHDLVTTWYFRRTNDQLKVYDGRTWESMNWVVRRVDGGEEVRWRDMPGVGE